MICAKGHGLFRDIVRVFLRKVSSVPSKIWWCCLREKATSNSKVTISVSHATVSAISWRGLLFAQITFFLVTCYRQYKRWDMATFLILVGFQNDFTIIFSEPDF